MKGGGDMRGGEGGKGETNASSSSFPVVVYENSDLQKNKYF